MRISLKSVTQTEAKLPPIGAYRRGVFIITQDGIMAGFDWKTHVTDEAPLKKYFNSP